jgi:hypothetical protein
MSNTQIDPMGSGIVGIDHAVEEADELRDECELCKSVASAIDDRDSSFHGAFECQH